MNLTDEEINNLACAYSSASPQEKNNIIKKLSFLIEIRLVRYFRFPNVQDLRQEGLEGLLFALRSYKAGKSDFAYWANQYIKTKITRSARQHASFKIPLKEKIKPIKAAFPTLKTNVTPESTSMHKDQLNKIFVSLNTCDKQEQEIFKNFIGLPESDLDNQALQVKYNLTSNQLRCAIRSIRKHIRKTFPELME
jgi:RNA polymerase sigma factor (sigma-70 family)